jgi:UDP-N-acetylglucosamine--N-acetylmuramyl-(pentapeptide) pyrophosphoryl-undecaprenol N-acetylglucosamine transferase
MTTKPKKILITAGGTGGHVYPAQALAQQLSKLALAPNIMFAAGGLSTNSYFDRSEFLYRDVSCGTMSKNPLILLQNVSKMLKGIYQSLQIINQYRPQVVVGFGSYYTIPVLIAAKLKGIPIVLHEANSVPGKANRWFAPYATYIGVHFPFTSSLLKGQVVEVGIPLREGFACRGIDKQTAMDYFQLPHQKLTLLIFGGSQGAEAINRVLKETLPFLQNLPVQMIHLTGKEEKNGELEALYEKYQLKACIKPFEANMQLAWKAADLFIGRSGASTIGEAMEFEVPGILIPYPHATEKHQDKNADFFVNMVGGGIKLDQEGLQGKQIADLLKMLLLDNCIDSKRKAIQSYKKRPRLDLCQLVLKAIK